MDTMEEQIPIEVSLDKLYPRDALLAQTARWSHLTEEFKRKFGVEPLFVARSPGRVNIIGEHIDYSLYDVLPMGIAADVIIAVGRPFTATSSSVPISIANVNSEKHRPLDFTVSSQGEVAIDASTHEWTNYFKAGLKGALEWLKSTNPDWKPIGFAAMVDGTVPAGGGLSSSAAFVCASALASIWADGSHNLEKKTLTELAIVSERAVGVNSGGMDQAASVCSIRGDALHVAFSPQLRAEAISFPKVDPPVTFMIAQSLVTSDKHVTAPVCYNLRVVEVTLAAAYLAACCGVELAEDSGPLKRSLRGFENAYFASSQAAGSGNDPLSRLRKLLALTKEHLWTQGYTRAEIAERLGISEAELESRFLSSYPIRAERFLLRQRAEHVFTEALRVHEFIALLKNTKSVSSSEEGQQLLQKMGALMNETQDSCRDMFECSCPELDEICKLARAAGAYGSRLTGAGWGGCSVHLVPRDKVDEVRKAWIDGYYQKTMKSQWEKMSDDEKDGCIVVTEPGVGSMVIEFEQ